MQESMLNIQNVLMGLMKMVDTVWVNTYILDAELEKLIMILKRILYDYNIYMDFFP